MTSVMISFRSCSDYAQDILRDHKNHCKAFGSANTFVQVDWLLTDLFHVQAQYCPRILMGPFLKGLGALAFHSCTAAYGFLRSWEIYADTYISCHHNG